MATEKRERQRANRQLKQEQQERQEKRDRVRQYVYLGTIVAVALVGGLALLSFATGDDSPDTGDATDVFEPAGEADDTGDQADGDSDGDEADPAADGSASTDGDSDEAAEPLPCPAEDGSSEPVLDFPAPPPPCTDPAATYTAVFDTNLGTITAELDAARAPNTVNNFVYLARYHYYDGTAFHRIIADFMIQGGDPNGDPPGTGGPGYTIDEETPQPGEYEVGSLAMAKRTAPGTTGAQFFIVTGPNGEALPPQYSLFGKVTEGLEVVQAIEALPTDDRDAPTEEIVVNTITITEG